MKTTYREAKREDLPMIVSLLTEGQSFLKAQNISQWQKEKFGTQREKEAIDSHLAYLWFEKKVLAFSFFKEKDDDYDRYDFWQEKGPYFAIHRVVISDEFRGKGFSNRLFKDYEEIALKKGRRLLRIDTHPDNQRMRHLLVKNGYQERGEILLKAGLRIAYEKRI